MMDVAPAEIAEHLFRLLIESIAGGGIRSEDWDRGDMSQRWNPSDVNLAGVSTGIEQIIFVFFSGGDVACDCIRKLRRPRRKRRILSVLFRWTLRPGLRRWDSIAATYLHD